MDISYQSLLVAPKLLFLMLCCLNFWSFAVDAANCFQADGFLQCLTTTIIPKQNLSNTIIYTPNTPNYTHILQDYIRNTRFDNSSHPIVIVTPSEIPQVQATVTCALKTGTQLKIRSGGHDYEGLSYTSETPFAILDMFKLSSIEIDLDDETAWVQAGATLGELYYKISEKSKVHAFPAGVCPTIGLGGHISGGGYGNLQRKYGLSIDNLVDATIVDAKGRVLDRNGMGEDVFWAIRGGGGASFGVILAYKIKLVRVPEVVTVFKVSRSLEENATDILHRWQSFAYETDENLFVRAFIQPKTINATKTATATFIAQYLGNAEELFSLVTSTFPEIGLKRNDCKETSWVKSLLTWAFIPDGTPEIALLNRTTSNPSPFKNKSDYVKKSIPKDGLRGVLERIASGNVSVMFNPYGGKMSEIPETATAFPHRAGNIYLIQYLQYWNERGPGVVDRKKVEIREFYDYMTPFVSENPREAFLNYRDIDIGSTDNGPDRLNEGRVYGEKYFKGNYDRLVRVKTEIDPGNLFRDEQSIPPQKFY